MATLTSPGVSVSVIDESISQGAGQGTVPFILIATAQDKTTPDGTATAPGTTKANSNKLYLMTSQRELLQTFGDPIFQSVGGNSVNGSPLNEYGLLAAHSYLGIANRAFVIRADVNLTELDASVAEPTAPEAAGTVWFDTEQTQYGIFTYNSAGANGPTWVAQDVSYIYVDTAPVNGDGADGDYAMESDSVTGAITYYVQVASAWVQLDVAADYQAGAVWPSFQSDGTTPLVDGDFWVKTTAGQSGAYYVIGVLSAETGNYVLQSVPVQASAPTGSGVSVGDFYLQTGATSAFGLFRYDGTAWVAATGYIASPTEPRQGPATGTYWYNPEVGADGNGDPTVDLLMNNGTGSWENITTDLSIAGPAIVNAGTGYAVGDTLTLVGGTFTTAATVIVTAETGGVIDSVDLVDAGVYTVLPASPAATTNDGAGDDAATVSFTQSGTGTTVYLQSSDPVNTVGIGNLVDQDIWVDTDQLDAYPVIKRWNLSSSQWFLVNNTDQTTNNGIIFADARPTPTYVKDSNIAGTYNGTGPDLDIDAPDPDAYPGGMLLWNTRFSTRNVKEWDAQYEVGLTAGTNPSPVYEGRWLNASGNDVDGSPKMGTNAQRAIVVQAMQEVLVSNTDVRSEFIFFNIMATPGYPETIDEMVALNIDRKETGFIVGDTPFDLPSSATALQAYATNAANAAGNGQDAILTADPYLGVYYPSGLSTNIDGVDVVVPPSHMMLRTMAYNDQVAYPWFAPAGLTRGRISNSSVVGYVNSEGEFTPVTLNEGQRDVLYTNNINPIAFVPGEGLVAYGQKTRNPFNSAMSRINVARLVNYIRYESEKLARPFLFEPNDSQTRDNVSDAFDRFLAELVTLRGLSDFLVVCDQSNNTPARIDRNELWVDLAIVPIKAIEFIYIPIRIKNTGADLAADIGNA